MGRAAERVDRKRGDRLGRLVGDRRERLFGLVERARFQFEQRLYRETLHDLVLSRSYCAKLAPADREPILTAVAQLYDETSDPDGLVLPYITECFRATKA